MNFIKLKNIIIFSLAIIVVLSVFIYSIHNLTKDRNMGFNSQELFINGGYKNIEMIIKDKQKEFDEYLENNHQRIEEYNIDFDSLILEIESGDLEKSIDKLNEVKKDVEDKSQYRKDVLIVLEQEMLSLNIEAYEMVENNQLTGREELYKNLENVEIIYDAFLNNLEVSEVNISDTPGSRLVNNDIQAWGITISRSTINVLLIIYALITVGIIIYRFIKDKDTGLLIVFSLVLLSSVFIYRKIEDNYYPPYMQINNMLGVNTNTEGKYFINFIPIMVADAFESNGGDFNTVDEDGEKIEVDWSKSKDIETWLYDKYQGGISSSNGEVLERIKNEMGLPSFEYSDGSKPIGETGWNF